MEASEETLEDVVSGFEPETDTERALSREPELVEGMKYGEPRPGHPEGAVAAHVADLLKTIDRMDVDSQRRKELRFIVLVHDAFKYRQAELPKEPGNHHARLASRFAERYTDDERVLATIEWHDWPFMLWKRFRRAGVPDEEMFDDLARRVPDPELFLEFCALDASTEGKDPEPVDWCRHALRAHGERAEATAVAGEEADGPARRSDGD
jgi:hypothetical protein